MRLDNVRFFIDGAFLLLLAEFLDKGHGLAFESTADLSPHSAWEQLHKLLIVHVKELIQVDTTVGELTESSLLLKFSSGLREKLFVKSSSSYIRGKKPRSGSKCELNLKHDFTFPGKSTGLIRTGLMYYRKTIFLHLLDL